MMLMLLDKNRGGNSDAMGMMMMASMMGGGQNPFANMFNQPVAQPVVQEEADASEETVSEPTVNQALNVILKNPDALAKLKEALKEDK
jgi:hypothetical protein